MSYLTMVVRPVPHCRGGRDRLARGGLARLGRRARHLGPSATPPFFYFYGGLAVLLFAVVSPIDYWATTTSSSASSSTSLIMFFAPILIVTGRLGCRSFTGSLSGARRVSGDPSSSVRGQAASVAGAIPDQRRVRCRTLQHRDVIWHLPALSTPPKTIRMSISGSCTRASSSSGVLFWLQIFPSYPIRPKLAAIGQSVHLS